MAIAFLLLLMAAATLVQDSSGLTCRCAASRTPGRTHSFCDLDMPNGCAECEGDVAAERAYRQLEAILSRTLDVVLQGRDKNCCLRSYRDWACSVRTVSMDASNATCRPCLLLCEHVMQCCPFFLPGQIDSKIYPGYSGPATLLDFRYAGLAAFNCPREAELSYTGASYGRSNRCFLFHNTTTCTSANQTRPVPCRKGQTCVVPICS